MDRQAQQRLQDMDKRYEEQQRDMWNKQNITRYFVEQITPYRNKVKKAYRRGDQEFKFPIAIQVGTHDPLYRGAKYSFDEQHIQNIFLQDDIPCSVHWMSMTALERGSRHSYLRIYSVIFQEKIQPPEKCVVS